MESKDRILCGLNLLLLNSHYDILVPPLAAVMVPCVCRPEGPVHSHCAPLIPWAPAEVRQPLLPSTRRPHAMKLEGHDSILPSLLGISSAT